MIWKTLLTTLLLCSSIAIVTGDDCSCPQLPANGPIPALARPVPSPAPPVDCVSLIFGMADCLPYLVGNGEEPEGSCCSGFKKVVHKDADCICQVLKSSVSSGINVNMTKAMKMPSTCGVSHFKLSSCKVSIPSMAPPPPPITKAPPAAAPPPESPDVPSTIPPPAAVPPPKSPDMPSTMPPPAAVPPPVSLDVPSKMPPPMAVASPKSPDVASMPPPPTLSPPSSSEAYTTCAIFSILFSLVVSASSFLNVLL